MSSSKFDEKQKERIKLHEVCSDCGKAKDKNFVNSVTGLIFGAKACECKPAQTLASFPVAECQKNRCFSDDSKSEDLGKRDHGQEINVNLGDRYEVIEVIGRGGMGTVFRARDKVLQKDFAIKVLREELATDESAVKRFEQEATSASELTHVNMLAVYDHGRTTSGAPYIVMDLLEGESLAQLLKRETRLEPSRAVNIAMQICDALSHAHMKGLIHRDLKPSNVMLVDNDNSADLVKVLDFGIAKLMPSTNRETQNLTQTGELFGSPSYMSPEQCLACSQDARSDIYSLGCMMYEMLTGKPPFSGKNPIQTVVQHINEEPLPLGKLVEKNTMPKGLESIVMRCLEKEADQRYQSMDQLTADLRLIACGQAPKQKRRTGKSKTSVDLLSAPFLAVYITLTVLISFFCSDQLSFVPLLWDCILSITFWRSLSVTRLNKSTGQERWKRALLGSLFALFTLVIPRLVHEAFDLKVKLPEALTDPYSLAITLIATLIVPITAFGWMLEWLLSRPVFKSIARPGLYAFFSLFLICLLLFARPQIAWIAFKLSESIEPSPCQRPALTSAISNQLLDLSIALNSKFVDAYRARAEKEYRSNKQSALLDYEKVFELTKDKNEPATGEGDARAKSALQAEFNIHFDMKNYDLALKDIERDIDLGQRSLNYVPALAYFTRARCFEKLGSYPRAIANYSAAIEEGNLQGYENRARLSDKLGLTSRALSDYSKAIVVDANNRKLYVHRAGLYEKLGDKSAALIDYTKVTSMPAIEAKQVAKEVAGRDTNLLNLYYTSVAYRKLGDGKKAAELLELAAKNGFKEPDEFDGYSSPDSTE